MQELKEALKKACQDSFGVDIEPELTRPEEKFGDYATNVALQLGKRLGKNPREIAEQLVAALKELPILAKRDVAGPGFINFTLTDGMLSRIAESATQLPMPLAGQTVVVEYSDPNPFKVLHVGHLYTSVVGDGVANLLEAAGAKVHRVNFGGDVGLHVAKTLWALLKELGGAYPEKLAGISERERSNWMAEAYIKGTRIYDESSAGNADIQIKLDILLINQIVYSFWSDDALHQNTTYSSSNPESLKIDVEKLREIYKITRQWSYDYFNNFYAQIGTHFEKYYPESATIEPGMKAVKENVGKVFEESDGAIVFKGEVHNMHTRVFINSQGLPTYETKDVGLIILKNQDYHFDRSIVITGNEQSEYMQVVLKAVEQIEPELAKKTTHITHGMVRLPGSQKMSSRLGNIVSADSVLEMARQANKAVNKQDNEDTALGAVKYSFLKHRLGADLVYDPAESVSLEGNSGPYLQYAHARACSILQKAGGKAQNAKPDKLDKDERSLARKLSEYPEVVQKATAELMPHHICTYLYELAQTFNSFYESSRIIGNEREALRLALVKSYQEVLKNGLGLLNIDAPESI